MSGPVDGPLASGESMDDADCRINAGDRAA